MKHETDKAMCGEMCSGLCCTRIENFGVTVGNVSILKDVNMHIHCGELTALIGPNGAGKSTLLKAILGEIGHTGQLKFVDAKETNTVKPLIGYVPQHLDFDIGAPVSVLDLFSASRWKIPSWLFLSKKIREKAVQSLERVKASHLVDKKLGALSGGELQRVMLALALDPIPQLLLLDEPVSGIDHNGLEVFYSTLSELKQNYDLSIILISHDFDLVFRHADRVVLLNQTILCSGTPQYVFNHEKMMGTFGDVWKSRGK